MPLVHGEHAVPHKPAAAARPQLLEEVPARPGAACGSEARRGYPAARTRLQRRGPEAAPRPAPARAPRGVLGAREPSTPASLSGARRRGPGRTHRPEEAAGRRTAASGRVTAPAAAGVRTRARWRARRRGRQLRDTQPGPTAPPPRLGACRSAWASAGKFVVREPRPFASPESHRPGAGSPPGGPAPPEGTGSPQAPPLQPGASSRASSPAWAPAGFAEPGSRSQAVRTLLTHTISLNFH